MDFFHAASNGCSLIHCYLRILVLVANIRRQRCTTFYDTSVLPWHLSSTWAAVFSVCNSVNTILPMWEAKCDLENIRELPPSPDRTCFSQILTGDYNRRTKQTADIITIEIAAFERRGVSPIQKRLDITEIQNPGLWPSTFFLSKSCLNV